MEHNIRKRFSDNIISSYNSKTLRIEKDKISDLKLSETELNPIICECEICDCGFTNHGDFNEHMVYIHQSEKFRGLLVKGRYKSDNMSEINNCNNDDNYVKPIEKPNFDESSFDQKKVVFPVINVSLLENALPEINQMMNEENEKVLRNIFEADVDANTSVIVDNTSTTEPKLMGLLESCAMIPRIINQLKEDNCDLLLTAQRKHNATEKMQKLNEKEVAFLSQRTAIMWQKIMNAEDKLEYQIEEQIKRELIDIEDQFSYCDNDFDVEDVGPSSEEIEDIVSQCLSRDVFELYFDESSTGYPQVVPEDLLRPKTRCKATYDCHICTAATFDRFSEYCAHIRRHKADTNWKGSKQQRQSCTICGNVVPVLELLKHMSKHIDHNRCSICQEFVSHADLDGHRLEHSKHFLCGVCGELYRSMPALRKHMCHHRTGADYVCDECGRHFAGLEKMVRHISAKHQSIDPAYAECQYCLEVGLLRTRHVHRYTDVSPCQLTADIKKHLYTVDACKFKCKVCLKVEKTAADFRAHMDQHANGNDVRHVNAPCRGRTFDCPDCKVRLLTVEKLREHKLCHCADKMYAKHVTRGERALCAQCGTNMPRSYLSFHAKKHDHFDRCPICFKFVTRHSVKDHVTAHDSDHVCDMCDERFSCEQRWAQHRWAHGRVVNRPCTDCTLSFSSELHRARHISLVHKRVDPEFVECYFCVELVQEKAEYHLFDANYCLRRCKLCNERFREATDLLAHVSMVHAQYVG